MRYAETNNVSSWRFWRIYGLLLEFDGCTNSHPMRTENAKLQTIRLGILAKNFQITKWLGNLSNLQNIKITADSIRIYVGNLQNIEIREVYTYIGAIPKPGMREKTFKSFFFQMSISKEAL